MATRKSKTAVPLSEETSDVAEIGSYARDSYHGYAMATILERELPSSLDGLKPVQRRILCTMRDLHLEPPARPTKSARIVGQALGIYHPHGDSSVYEAMVLMSQAFATRYPLVMGEGNFGTRDGDRAAAYRYTEARLSPLSVKLLEELQQGTVDFVPNYDGKSKEPVLLPAELPLLLLNGATGIAVGMSTSLPPHNLGELLIAAKKLLLGHKPSLKKFLKDVPGPDFASGCLITSTPEEIAEVYRTGQGTLRLRARYREVPPEKGKGLGYLEFYEIPKDTSTASILSIIDKCLNPQVPIAANGRRGSLTNQQAEVKKLFENWVDHTSDASGRDTSPVCLRVYPVKGASSLKDLADLLFAYTPLEKTVAINCVAVSGEGKPACRSPLDWLVEWCDWRLATVRRRLLFEQIAVQHTKHIMDGRLSALDHLPEIIQIILHAEEPRAELVKRFNFSEDQATDILELRLKQLAKLEAIKVEEKKVVAEKRLAELDVLLTDESLLRKLTSDEMMAAGKPFIDERRTGFALTEKAVAPKLPLAELKPGGVRLGLTRHGWISYAPLPKGLETSPWPELPVKIGDALVSETVAETFEGHLLLLDSTGRGYALPLTELSGKGDCVPPTQLFTLPPSSGMVAAVVASSETDEFLLASSEGYGFVVSATDWLNTRKAGKTLMRVTQGFPVAALPVRGKDKKVVLVIAADGKAAAFGLEEVAKLPGGKGVKLLNLAKDADLAKVHLLTAEVFASGRASVQAPDGQQVVIKADRVAVLLSPRSASRKGNLIDPKHAHAR